MRSIFYVSQDDSFPREYTNFVPVQTPHTPKQIHEYPISSQVYKTYTRPPH